MFQLLTLLLLSFPLAALDVDVPPAVQPAWERLVSAHPVPPGIESGSIVAQDLAGNGVRPGFKVVETTILVPVARFWDAPAAVTSALVESGRVRLLPIESVVLPDIALPVDGLFQGDPG